MDIYIDRGNLLSFVKCREQDPELHYEAMRLLKRHLHMVFNFNKASLSNDEILILSGMLTGRGDSESKDEYRDSMYPERPLKTNFCTNQPWPIHSSAYLVDDDKVRALQQAKSIMIGGVGEELDVFDNLFCDENFELHQVYNIQNKTNFGGWEQLESDGHILPCSDIIIADRYLFAADNPTSMLESNILKILGLFAKIKQNQKVNILFFTDEVSENVRDYVKKRIEALFGKKSGVKVTFVEYNYDRPHDRFILTNYRLFRSGDSFNYYDDRGNKKTHGLSLDVDSSANCTTSALIEDIREYYQNICDKIPDRIYGDKISNFISFTK